jgi:hypothetical protein
VKNMKRTTFVIATSLVVSVLSIVACSSDSGTAAGPANAPPTQTPGTDSGGPSSTTDGGPGVDGSSSGATCTGPTFDNSRIPGWPTVPQP